MTQATKPINTPDWLSHADGALIIDKPEGISSFGVIDHLSHQLGKVWEVKRRDQPKMGHGGTLDPFATGVLIVCVGRAVKLARYFLGATKTYQGRMRFGETSVSGDYTDPVVQTSEVLPTSLAELNAEAARLQGETYLQTPPMHSAKKKNGVPLYELARQGIEVERAPKQCTLFEFGFNDFKINEQGKTVADYFVTCSSGTYVRKLAQDFANRLESVALLESLRRTQSGAFTLAQSITLPELDAWVAEGKRPWTECKGWIDFNQLLAGYFHIEATQDESTGLQNGQQQWLNPIVERATQKLAQAQQLRPVIQGQEAFLAIQCEGRLIAVAHKDPTGWGLERVFTRDEHLS